MNEGYSTLKPDKAWQAMGIASIRRFEDIISKISLKPNVAPDIVKRIEVVKKLILHGYFVYEFLDVALINTVLTFEMALKVRYREIECKNVGKSMDLYQLIKWGAERCLFDDDEKIIQNLRKIRNEIAHPDRYNLMGFLSIDMIQRTVEIINEMYEDVELRKLRINVEKEIVQRFEGFVENGAVLELNGVQGIVFLATLLWYDNSVKPEKFHFLFWPIFDPVPKDGKVEEGKPVIISCNSWRYVDGKFYFGDAGLQNEAMLMPLTNNKKIDEFKAWKQDFDQSDFPLKYFIGFRIAELRIEAKTNFGK